MKTQLNQKVLAGMVSATLASGCAAFDNKGVRATAEGSVHAIVNEQSRFAAVVMEKNEPQPQYDSVPYQGNNVSANLSRAGFVGAIREVAKKMGYSVVVMSNIDASRKVTLGFQDLPPEQAIRTIALAAGYAVAFDRNAHRVTVADNAIYTFRLPSNVLAQMESSFTVGGNPIAGGGSSGGASTPGMPSQGMGAVSSIKSEFTVSGKYLSAKDSITRVITRVAGANAEVNVSPEIGLVTVRSNAQALMRVTEFLTSFSRDALARVQIEASIVEVALNDKLQYGIDWTRVLRDGATTVIPALNTAGAVANPAATVTITTLKTNAIINALQQDTRVRVVSQPRLTAMNHMPAVLFDGTQVPYLGSITSTVSGGASSTAQSSGQVSYATDGLSLSIRPDILNERDVQISLTPVISTINGFANFTLGDGSVITAPNQKIKQSFLEVLGESGKTLIIAGARYKSESKDKTGVPGLARVPLIGSLFSSHNNLDVDRELVILLRTEIVMAPKYNPVIAESI